jgi:hypothetical protein
MRETDEFIRVWKAAVVTYFKVHICLKEGTKEGKKTVTNSST